MFNSKGFLLLFLLAFGFFFSQAQQNHSDSLFLIVDKNTASFKSISKLDPNRAALMSAVLPGLGQAYNGQAWKIPIIYGGAIIFGHYINYNHRLYSTFKNALIAEKDNDQTTINPYRDLFNATSLERNRDVSRRNRDYLMIISIGYYLLNVIDAHVSAHLHEFEVNDNLSMNISPSIQSTPLFSHSIGFSVSLNLK